MNREHPGPAETPFWKSYPILLVIQLVVTWLNRGHVHEQGMFQNLIMDTAVWFRGGPLSDSPTYPMWGYPALVALAPNITILLILQSAVGAIAPAMLLPHLERRFPAHRRLARVLVFAGIPWFVFASVKWPVGFGISIAVVAMILFAEAIERNSLKRVAAAGLVMGIALNVRSDPILILPGLFVLSLLLLAARRPRVLPVRAAGLFWAVAWICLIPWALYYRHWTGAYSLTSSNGYFVAYTVLGQLPNNPWGAVNDDDWGLEFLKERGYTGHSFGHGGNEIMKREFINAVRTHPGAFAQKVIRNMTRVYLGGFYNGDPRISAQQDSALDIAREKIKLAVGVNPNNEEIAGYRASGRWETLRPAPMTLAALGYLVMAAAAGILFIFMATAGVVVARQRIFTDPLLFLSLVTILYQIVIVIGVLKYEPRFMNAVYPYLLPFVIALWASLTIAWRQRRARRRAATAPSPSTVAA